MCIHFIRKIWYSHHVQFILINVEEMMMINGVNNKICVVKYCLRVVILLFFKNYFILKYDLRRVMSPVMTERLKFVQTCIRTHTHTYATFILKKPVIFWWLTSVCVTHTYFKSPWKFVRLFIYFSLVTHFHLSDQR